MPNWCLSEYYVTIEDENDETAKKSFERFAGEMSDPDVIGEMWLIDLWERNKAEPADGFSCRTHLEDVVVMDDAVVICSDDAWEPCAGSLMRLLKEFYPGLCVYFFGEEPMNEVFVTNDADRKYVTTKYVIYESDGSVYFDTDADLIKYANSMYKPKREIKSVKAALNLIDKNSSFPSMTIEYVGLWDWM